MFYLFYFLFIFLFYFWGVGGGVCMCVGGWWWWWALIISRKRMFVELNAIIYLTQCSINHNEVVVQLYISVQGVSGREAITGTTLAPASVHRLASFI